MKKILTITMCDEVNGLSPSPIGAVLGRLASDLYLPKSTGSGEVDGVSFTYTLTDAPVDVAADCGPGFEVRR